MTCAYCGYDHIPDPFYCISRLQEKVETIEESHAWEISPAMAQAKIDELNKEVDRLKATLAEREKEVERLLVSLQMAYRKHHLNDDSIGWEELSTSLLNTLCNVMGDEGYQEWLNVWRDKL